MHIEVMSSERALLGFMLAKFNKLDPDVIVVGVFLTSRSIFCPKVYCVHATLNMLLELMSGEYNPCKVLKSILSVMAFMIVAFATIGK